MSSVSEYFSGLFGGIKSLLTGMGVTWKELWTKKITEQYPENRATLVIADRFRGELVMPHDENNEHACTSCGICQMNCPNGTIRIVSKTIETEDGKKKKILDEYFYDLGMCTFCNLCVITCPSDAIKFSGTFENSLFTRSKLIQKLNNEGSKLREKKKESKPVVDKPTAPKVEVAASVAPTEKAIEAKAETPATATSALNNLVEAVKETKVEAPKPVVEVKPTIEPTVEVKESETTKDSVPAPEKGADKTEGKE